MYACTRAPDSDYIDPYRMRNWSLLPVYGAFFLSGSYLRTSDSRCVLSTAVRFWSQLVYRTCGRHNFLGVLWRQAGGKTNEKRRKRAFPHGCPGGEGILLCHGFSLALSLPSRRTPFLLCHPERSAAKLKGLAAKKSVVRPAPGSFGPLANRDVPNTGAQRRPQPIRCQISVRLRSGQALHSASLQSE
jgi:hypothetical protein